MIKTTMAIVIAKMYKPPVLTIDEKSFFDVVYQARKVLSFTYVHFATVHKGLISLLSVALVIHPIAKKGETSVK